MLRCLLLLSASLSFTLLTGCATSNGGMGNLTELQQLNAPSDTGQGSANPGISQIRMDAIKETALSVGARAALANRSDEIDDLLTQNKNSLDATYNFSGLLLAHNVVPPILMESQNNLNLAGPDSIRLERKVYQIVNQAHFVTTPPTWRSYLWMDYPTPERPNITLLPRNSEEQSVWNHYVEMGWDNGITQANNIFSANLAKLNRDYNGMILYLKLYAENMVSAPYVAKVDLGITGNASQMNINDQVLRITALSELNLNSKTWKPALVPDPMQQYRQQQQLTTAKQTQKNELTAPMLLSK